MATEASTASTAEWAWRQQSVWSQAASRLKRSLDRWRAAALWATIAGAVLATLAAQVSSWSALAGKLLALAAAVAVGFVPLLRRRTGADAVRDWTRARSVSEALKSEVYSFLAGVAPYRGTDRDEHLQDQLDGVLRDASDLLRHTVGVQPVTRSLPAVHDVGSYIVERLDAQIEGYYRPRAAEIGLQLSRVRAAELGLGAVAIVLGALAAALQVGGTAAWIAVVTTVTAALTAHAAASRYEYQLIEYLRTAAELERLRGLSDRLLRNGAEGEDGLVRRSEHVISIQNEAWMAKWAAEVTPADDRPPAVRRRLR